MPVIDERFDSEQSDQFTLSVLRPPRRTSRACRSMADDGVRCPTVVVQGCLDEEAAALFTTEVMDLVFALPACDVVLDLSSCTELGPAAVAAIRNTRLALEDRGAQLRIIGLGTARSDSGAGGVPRTTIPA